jgi:predicted O-methyltransferase YrrM
MFKTPNEIQFVDPSCNLILPWYTKPCLDEIMSLDFKNWDVFEWGGGCSTVWYSQNCNHVDTLEHSPEWAGEIVNYLNENKKTNFSMKVIEVPPSANSFHANQEEYLSYIKTLNKKWDCIIVDGSYRNDALKISENFLKPNGIIIFDNYNQDTSGYPVLFNEDYMNSKYKLTVYTHPDREYWKTAIWWT